MMRDRGLTHSFGLTLINSTLSDPQNASVTLSIDSKI
jgi:hypothetical protein